MSAANLDAIKNKYKFKEISIATWRDPSLSVHPARGGPQPPVFSFEDTSKPYIPRYRVRYDPLPNQTDDEETGNEAETSDQDAEASVESSVVPPPKEPEADGQDLTEDITNPEISRDPTAGDVEVVVEAVEQSILDEPVEPEVQEPLAETAMASSELEHAAASETTPSSDAGEATPPMMQDDGSPEHVPNETNDEPIIDTEGNTSGGEPTEERRVSFAPGTPEPRPTPRKKKTAKGTKSKKKRIAVPIESLPPDIVAIIDGADSIQPLSPPSPAAEADEPSENRAKDVETIDDKQDHPEPTVEPAATDAPAEETPEATVDVSESPAADLAVEDDAPEHTTQDTPVTEKAEAEPITDSPEQDLTAPATEGQTPSSTNGDDAPLESEPVTELPTVVALDPIVDILVVPEKASKKKKSKLKKKSKFDFETIATGLGIDLAGPTEIEPETAPVKQSETAPKDTPAEPDTSDAPHSNESEAPAPAEEAVSAIDSDDDLPVIPGALPVEAPSAPSTPKPTDEGLDVAVHSGGASAPVDDEQSNDARESSPDGALSPVDSAIELDDTAGTSGEVAPSADIVESVSTEDVTGSESSGESGSGADEGPREPKDTVGDETVDDSQSNVDEVVAESEELVADAEGRDVKLEDQSEVAADNDEGKQVEDVSGKDGSGENGEDGTNAEELSTERSKDGEEAGEDEEKAATENQDSQVKSNEPEPTEAIEKGDNKEDKAAADEAPSTPNPDGADKTTEATADAEEPVAVEDPCEGAAVKEETGEGGETPKEQPQEPEAVPEAPPSPTLSKSSTRSSGSRNQKANHWEREHKPNALKEVLEDDKVMQRPRGTDQVRIKDRHRRRRRSSSSPEEEEDRRNRKLARKLKEAARLAEEERRLVEEEEKRRLRHEARRNARARAESEAAIDAEIEARRKRLRELNADREPTRERRQEKLIRSKTMPSVPKALGFATGESVHSSSLIRGHGGAYRPAPSTSKRKDEIKSDVVPGEPAKDDKIEPPASTSGSKRHHKHHHHRHRSGSDRQSRSEKDSEMGGPRPAIRERPRSFFGTFMRW